MTQHSANQTEPRIERFGFGDLASLQADAGERVEGDLLAWGAARFGVTLVVANSLGPEDVVIVDMLAERGLAADARVFTLDTGRLHPETYTLLDKLRERYGIRPEVYFPRAADVEALVREGGMHSFYQSIDARHACCNVRKVEPLKRVLATASAWVTGIRREQSVTRFEASNVELDLANGGLLKLNPLVNWTRDQLWDTIRARDIPYNPLHDQGFASIGCAPCTRAIAPGEEERAGRWWWEQPDQRECGLHTADRA